MKPLILAALGVALAAFPALAQDQAPAPAPMTPVAGAPSDEAPPPPPPGPGPKGPFRGGPRGDHDGPPPPPSKGAHFRLESGDNRIDVKCADDEPMQACADITMRLLDRFIPAGGPASPAQP